MDDSTTPATETPTTDNHTAEEKAQAADAFIAMMTEALKASTTEHEDGFDRMRAEETDVTLKLCEEICERLAQLARHFDIPYTKFFPLQACDLLMPKWQMAESYLKTYIEDGEAKAQLDARYEAEA